MATSPSRRPKREIPPTKLTGPRWGFIVYQIGIVVFLAAFVVIGVNTLERLLPGDLDWTRMGILASILAVCGITMILGGRVLMTRGARAEMLPRTADGDPLQQLTGRRSIPPNMPTPIMKVRCQSCQALNDEANKFCGHCGQPL